MPGPSVAGTFSTGSSASVGNLSDSCIPPSGVTTMRLSINGLDGSNTVKTQRRTAPGGAWADQVTYNSNQNGTAITVAAGQEWRLVTVTMQPIRDIRYLMEAL